MWSSIGFSNVYKKRYLGFRMPHCDPVKPQKSKPAGGKSVNMIIHDNIINIWWIDICHLTHTTSFVTVTFTMIHWDSWAAVVCGLGLNCGVMACNFCAYDWKDQWLWCEWLISWSAHSQTQIVTITLMRWWHRHGSSISIAELCLLLLVCVDKKRNQS